MVRSSPARANGKPDSCTTLLGVRVDEQASSADLRFRSAAFHPESSLSFSNPRAPINGQECAIVTKPNRSYRNGRRRRHTAIIYAPARGAQGRKAADLAKQVRATCLLARGTKLDGIPIYPFSV